MPDQSVSTSQAEAVTQPTEISSSVTSSAPQPSYKVGDVVRLHKATGGSISWNGNMDRYCEKPQTITWIDYDSFHIKGCSMYFPLESLEPASAYVPAVGDVVEVSRTKDTLFSYKKAIIAHYNGCLNYVRKGAHGEVNSNGVTVTKIGDYPEKFTSYATASKCVDEILDRFSAPTLTGTYAEKPKQCIEHHGIKMDSTKVRITRKPEDGEGEWTRLWKLDDYIGKVLTVYSTCDNDTMSVHTKSDFLYAPFFVLEPVK